MKLQNIFDEFLNSKPIFKNRDVLSVSFTPENIPHREKQIEELGRILAPALKGGKPSNVFIYGRCGTGKSLVTTLVSRELEKAARNNKIKVIYVNCKMKRVADTEYRLLAYLLKYFDKNVPFTGLPTDMIYREFFDTIDKEKQIIILILDEIDILLEKTGDNILYNLIRANETLKNAKLSIIGITNDLSLVDKLDPRVKSSLGEEEMIFPPYNAVQLQEILRERAKLAFEEGVLDNGVIEKCAALAAQEHGDARRALDLLRVAAELAERRGEEKVKIEHIDKAEEKIDMDRIMEIVKSQPKQSQAVLYSIIKLYNKGEIIETSNVLDEYNEICKKVGLKTLTSRRISDLIAELDMFGIITTRTVSRGRYGRTRMINLAISKQIIEKIEALLKDNFY